MHSVAWSCDGSRLASGSFDKTVTFWNLESDRLVSNIIIIKFLHSHTILLDASSCLLQGREGNYKGHSGSVDQLCWHPTKPEVLVTASGDKTIRIWDVRGKSLKRCAPEPCECSYYLLCHCI